MCFLAFSIIVWETYKVTIQGFLIHMVSRKKALREHRIREISSLLAQAEKPWISQPTPSNRNTYDTYANKLDLLLTAPRVV